MALSADVYRTYKLDANGGRPAYFPVKAEAVIYHGAAVGEDAAGAVRGLVAADPFVGFAVGSNDNTGGAAGDLTQQVIQEGVVELAVVGVDGAEDILDTVYASADGTFTLTSSSNSAIGKIVRRISGTLCEVFFQGVAVRSI